MIKRNNNEIQELSLLENPNMETQAKLSLWKGINWFMPWVRSLKFQLEAHE